MKSHKTIIITERKGVSKGLGYHNGHHFYLFLWFAGKERHIYLLEESSLLTVLIFRK